MTTEVSGIQCGVMQIVEGFFFVYISSVSLIDPILDVLCAFAKYTAYYVEINIFSFPQI